MAVLKKLGWDGDLTAEERASHREGRGRQDQLEDRPVGRHPAGRDQAWLRRRSATPRRAAVVWTFPDPVPIHREPLYTSPARPLVDKYPTYADTKVFYRLPTLYASIQNKDHSPRVPDHPDLSGRLVEYEGGGDEAGRTRGWPSCSRRCSPRSTRPTATTPASGTASSSGSTRRKAAKIKVKAMFTERVARGVAFVPFHFGGWSSRARTDARKYPKGADPYVLGEAANTAHDLRLRLRHPDAGSKVLPVPDHRGLSNGSRGTESWHE